GGQELRRLESVLLLRCHRAAARRHAVLQAGQHRLDHREQSARLLLAATDTLLHRDGAALEAVEIGEHQLGLDRLDIADRIDRALDMHDVVVLEAAYDMADRIDFAEMTENLLAMPVPFLGAA